jgi:hypothetical protein
VQDWKVIKVMILVFALIETEREMLQCLVCEGRGRVRVVPHERDHVVGMKRGELFCMWCNGTGFMDEAALRQYTFILANGRKIPILNVSSSSAASTLVRGQKD